MKDNADFYMYIMLILLAIPSGSSFGIYSNQPKWNIYSAVLELTEQ